TDCKHFGFSQDRYLLGDSTGGTRGRRGASGSDHSRCAIRQDANGIGPYSGVGMCKIAADDVVGSVMSTFRSALKPCMGVIERYRTFLPVSGTTPVISLNEGSTPLIPAPRLSSIVGRDCRVYLKFEGLNPTGSFKDRGMTVAVSKAVEEGSKAVITASTGNTSASAAAYAARAGLKSVVLVPEGNIALGKLSQALMHGAQVLSVQGNFDEALELVKEI